MNHYQINMKIDKEHILNEVIKIASKAGEFIRHEGANFDRSKIQEKGKNNLVSYVDYEAERLIAQTLKFILPDAGFITEEDTETGKADDYNWVIDPLDGTTNFLHGLAPYSVSIALLYKDKPVLGVVYEVNRDECFYATDEGKAYLNRKEISISSIDKFQDGLYITGYPYKVYDNLENFFKVMDHFMKNTHGLRRSGSAAADLCYVASGRVEGFFESGLNPWDVAAGALIVQRAGGVVTDFKGKEKYLYGKELIASGAVHKDMLDVIQKHYTKN